MLTVLFTLSNFLKTLLKFNSNKTMTIYDKEENRIRYAGEKPEDFDESGNLKAATLPDWVAWPIVIMIFPFVIGWEIIKKVFKKN